MNINAGILSVQQNEESLYLWNHAILINQRNHYKYKTKHWNEY